MSNDQLVKVLNDRLKHVHPNVKLLSDSQLKRLMTPPAQNVQCWLEAVIYYFQTGDIIGAVAKAIECLIAKGVNLNDLIQCFSKFFTDIVENGFTIDSVLDLLDCLFSSGKDGGDGELEPPNYRNVKRCG